MLVSSLRSLLLLLALLPAIGLAEDQPLRLMYRCDAPVIQVTEVTIDIRQSPLGVPLNLGTQQRIDAEVSVAAKGEGGDAFVQLPCVLTYTPRHVEVRLSANDHTQVFDTDHPDTSHYLAQLSSVMQRPILLEVGADGYLTGPQEGLQGFYDQFSLAGQLLSQQFFAEMTQRLFAFADEDLVVGNTVQRQLAVAGDDVAPAIVDYEVIVANDDELRVAFTGTLSPQVITVYTPEKNSNEQKVQLSLTTGTVQGQGQWKRRHALVFFGNSEASYAGDIKVGEHQWPVEVVFRCDVRSHRL